MLKSVLSLHFETNGLPGEGEPIALSASIWIGDTNQTYHFARLLSSRTTLESWSKGAQNAHQVTPDDLLTCGWDYHSTLWREEFQAWLDWFGVNHGVTADTCICVYSHDNVQELMATNFIYKVNIISFIHSITFPNLTNYMNWVHRHLGISPEQVVAIPSPKGDIYIRNMAQRNMLAYFKVLQVLASSRNLLT